MAELVRAGSVVKDGSYTLTAGEQMPNVWLTEKGMREHEQETLTASPVSFVK